MPGSVVLLGGEPGIGKSTLLLTLVHGAAKGGVKVLYASAEESLAQIRMTAGRLKTLHPHLYLMADSSLQNALHETRRLKPQVLIWSFETCKRN